MNQRMLLAAGVAVATILALAGCAGIGKRLETPRISLANIKVAEASGLETVFEVQLRVLNPNEVDLEVKGVDCELEVNGQPFATGISDARVTVPAYGAGLVPVTAYSSMISIFRSLLGMAKSAELGYRIKGKLRIGGDAILPPLLPFESSGTFDFAELAGIGKR
jgi:LEA14-like dessication related protein